jgi:hypothetical protein
MKNNTHIGDKNILFIEFLNNKQTVGFNNGKQWQTNLGGNENWKNRPCHCLRYKHN